MTKKKKISDESCVSEALPNGIINPFSPSFLETWKLWKDYKWEQHQFKYKGCISEQVKLMQLFELANGDEIMATKIVEQSIGEGWSGLFALKNNKHGSGTHKQSNSGSKIGTSDARINAAENF